VSRRIRIVVQYEGTNYVGWQLQENGVSIQQRLNEAIFAITGEHVRVHGSGRTDSGVHALTQVAHFDTSARMPASKFAVALNAHLPGDIRVLYSEETDETFHARFSAKSKTYRYSVLTGPSANVFTRNTSLHIHVPFDYDRLARAARDVRGEHDFAAFMSSGSKIESTVRTVTESFWEQSGPFLFYYVSANGFLYNMVRILVGTMLEIGVCSRPQDSILHAFETKNRSDAGPTAPAHGLTLVRVVYDDFDTSKVLFR